ncbi:hypothetical protein H1R20_g12831, partial [Candolleomyces eurysporus]
MFPITSFNVEGAHDPTVGLVNGQLSISGNLFRRQVFTPVIDQFSNYPKSNPLKSTSLYMLATSEHSKQRVEATSHDQVLQISQSPSDSSSVATLYTSDSSRNMRYTDEAPFWPTFH